jgi:nucleotide-binding universal stress UspA family protein
MGNSEKTKEERPAGPQLQPLQIRRILAPTDLTELSASALRYAIRLGLSLGAEVVALHVSEIFLDPPGGSMDLHMVSQEDVDGWRHDAKRQFDEYLERLTTVPDNVVRVLRSSQDPWKEITIVAEEMSADLLVVSTHHHSALRYFFQLSDTEKIVRHAPCPVLVVHENS